MSLLIFAAIAASPATADEKHHTTATTSQTGGQLTEGEVRKIDKEAKKITIQHGPIQNLDTPAMTMVFQVKDLAMLDQVKSGDKVNFEAEKSGGAFTVIRIVPVAQSK